MSETTETEDWFTEKCRDPEFVKAYLEEQRIVHADDLRTAVEAERGRCAKFDPLAAQCTQCEAVVGMPCHANLWGKDNPQICADRIRAAIRQNPTPATRQESGGEGEDGR